LRGRRRQASLKTGSAVHRVPVQIGLGHAAGSRIAESGIDGAVEPGPEAPADRRDDRDIEHREGHRPLRGGDADRVGTCGHERAEEPAAISRDHFDKPSRDKARQLVPLQIQRPGIVGLEFEHRAIHTDHLARDAVAIRQGDDIGAILSGCRRGKRGNHQGGGDRQPNRWT
jgi:hypothetical protein